MTESDRADLPLPRGIRSRFVEDINGLTMHVLEAGDEQDALPAAAPWLSGTGVQLAQGDAAAGAAGFHVVAPDQRGYGRTTGWDRGYDGDLLPFRMLNLVQGCLALVSALGYRSVAAVIGHDFGSPVAAWCALARPDVFRSVVMMSAPFAGPPRCRSARRDGRSQRLDRRRATFSTSSRRCRGRASTISGTTRRARPTTICATPPQGMHAFLRAYYHHKSADWKENRPFRLAAWSADELAKLPTYYIMDLAQGMAETVARRDAFRRRDRRMRVAARSRARACTARNTAAPGSRAA